MATIEIDGNTIEVENGKMIIEVADDQGIYIPRFCYHKKLSVAANCRMCLVEIENSKKTVPACATPINDGMKIYTKSKAARASQEAVMEFLLINHPLDCPICDQGGECELQDISMGFGKDESNYTETKRAVEDDNLGELIATEMTRCIQCTRCVRFCDEIAGLPELGGIGRGENMQISTYVQHNMQSEVSGNIIDLCPVGALTSKPYRFTARPWEMVELANIAPHDCLGSNIYLHTRRDKVMRVVPRENDAINETWLSDRDRFSYLGLNSQNRLAEPLIKVDGKWEKTNWKNALEFVASGIMKILKNYGPQNFAAFSSPSATIEEAYLLQKMLRTFGIENLDSRLLHSDFRDQNLQPLIPKNGIAYAELENQESLFIVGCNIDKELPLAAIKVRKASINGAEVSALNPIDYSFKFNVHNKIIAGPQYFLNNLAKILAASLKNTDALSAEIAILIKGIQPNEYSHAIANSLSKKNAVIITGAIAENHPEAAIIRTLIHYIAENTGAKIVRFTNGANSAGMNIAGMLPNKKSGGHSISEPGLTAQAAISAKLKGYLLHAIEPGYDFADSNAARQAMLNAEFVVALSAFRSDELLECANVILPIAPFAETSGTYINVDGLWQTTKGAVKPFGEARPAWKVLRVLANTLLCDGFEYTSSDEVLSEIKHEFQFRAKDTAGLFHPENLPEIDSSLYRIGERPLYRTDALVRQAKALQNCGSSQKAEIRLNSDTAQKYNLSEFATVSQGENEIKLQVTIDNRIADDAVWVPSAMQETVNLGEAFSSIIIR